MVHIGRTATAALLAYCLVAPALAVAQTVTAAPGDGRVAMMQKSPAQTTERTVTGALNQQQAASASAQNEANTQSREEYERGMAEYRAAQAVAAAQRTAYEAELVEIRRRTEAYQAAYARWQADVAACTAGDYARCRSSAPAPQ